MQYRMRILTAASALGVAGALGACSELGIGGSAPLSLSFASTAASSSQLSFSAPLTGGGHTLDVTSAQLQIARAELERAGSGADSDAADSDGEGCGTQGCESFVSGPLTVDIPVDGGVVTPFTADVTPGRYSEVEFDLGAIRMRGTYDGTAFDVTVPLNLKSELEFHPPIEVGGTSTKNITIATPLQLWLVNPDGSLVDPRQLESNAELRSAFRSRVRATLRSFADQNRDGEDSDGDR